MSEDLKVTGAGVLVKLSDNKVYQVKLNKEETLAVLHYIKDYFTKDHKLPIDGRSYDGIDVIENLK